MKTEEAKKYCVDVVGMSNSDFTKANQEDAEIDGVNTNDWIHVFTSSTECGSECEMKTAIELATEHKYWSDPKKVDDYIDFMIAL